MVKPLRTISEKKVRYTKERWQLLSSLRKESSEILSALNDIGLNALAHGSIARGDINSNSDIDVIIPQKTPSFKVELAIQKGEFKPIKREIVMATPWQLPKAHIIIDDKRMITFPLLKPKRLELEFYKFGGEVGLKDIKDGKRVPGIDKRLVMINPTKNGHEEIQVIGRESEVAKIIGISTDTVQERIQVLSRRDKIGRTGVFLRKILSPRDNFESALKRMVDKNPEIKRRFKKI